MFMRASNYNPEVFGHCISMPKLNGLRAIYIPGKGFFSREGVRWNDAVLAHIKVPPTSFPIDGELYRHGMRLDEITEAVGVTRLEPGPDAAEVQFNVFDIIKPGRALQRMMDLTDWFERSKHLMYNLVMVKPTVCYNKLALDEAYARYVKLGYEGQMLKSIFGEYVGQGPKKAKTINIQKRKDFLDGEFTCVGVEISTEPRMEGLVGALIFVTDAGVKFKVGTGFTREDRVEWAAKPPTGQTATVRYLTLSEAGLPQNSSFVTWREDV